MIADLLLEPETIAFTLLAIVYVLGMKYIEANERRSRHIGDEEYLASMAKSMNCSEYDLFLVAAKKWRVSISQIEDDFKRYLIDGILPHYVRDFVRKNRSTGNIEKDDKINPGGKLPASWSA
jgi:hypothetical protein